MIRKLLIANRGEIACRIIRTAHEQGIATVAVYSEADAQALHVHMADEAVLIGAAPVAASYLRGEAIIAAARATGADAIHPGYGFLSENPEFVEAVAEAELTFIGPPAEAIRAMGLKDRAKMLMDEAGVPIVPGYHGADQDSERLAAEAAKIGYPVLIKARAGGGGKGMRLVEEPAEFASALASAQREGQASFGDAAVLIEKYIQSPRHIEVQIMGDAHGDVIHLHERDCSLQRRHQKVIEEAPAPGMTDAMRNAMGAAAVAAARAVGYQNAGTVEFIVDGSGPLHPDGFWFMEMNTRLQVEHPVTEAVTGLDLVALQLSVAQGAKLPLRQDEVPLIGHAFEARLYAEDPANGFLPATGPLSTLKFSKSARVDTGVRQGDAVTPHYDPMIAKIITHGPDRASALRRMERALAETQVAGCATNRAFLQRLTRDEDFTTGHVDTGLIARRGTGLTASPDTRAEHMALAALAMLDPGDAPHAHYRHFGPARQIVWFEGDPAIEVIVTRQKDGYTRVSTPLGEVTYDRVRYRTGRVVTSQDGNETSVIVLRTGNAIMLQSGADEARFVRHDPAANMFEDSSDKIVAPMPGRIIKLMVARGASVKKGAPLLVMEAMKMEHTLAAPCDGVIAELLAQEGDQVAQGADLITLQP